MLLIIFGEQQQQFSRQKWGSNEENWALADRKILKESFNSTQILVLKKVWKLKMRHYWVSHQPEFWKMTSPMKLLISIESRKPLMIPLLKALFRKKREDFFHQAAIASLMKMYGDHHILYHLWHDWLPKVYHCNRWCPWHCHYCPFIILICPPAHPNSSSDGQQSPNFTWLASIYTQHNKSVQNEFPFQFYVNLECMNCWLID